MDVDEESFASKRAEILKEIEILDHKFNQQKPPRSNTSQDFLKQHQISASRLEKKFLRHQ